MESYRPEGQLFINGEFIPALTGRKIDLYNASTEEFYTSVDEAGAEDVDLAVSAAKAALSDWSELSATERGQWLYKLADAIEIALPEIAFMDAITMGRPSGGSNPMELVPLRYFAGMANSICGDASLNTANMVNMSLRQPYGVCGAIIPWNSPLSAIMAKVGPALVTGNTLVLKSSEKAPLTGYVVARCAKEIGLPKGVLNIICGYGRPCGEAIAKHMEIRKVAFTGSEKAGRAIKKAAAESNLKNVTLELGGKSPLIIFDDADLDKAIQAAARSILMNSGQVCIASSRVYIHKTIEEPFISGIKKLMSESVADDPLVASTTRGPQADKLQFQSVMGFLADAKQSGLDIILGGEREKQRGYFVQPTIIRNPPEDSKVMKEEIFGPVLCVSTFEDEENVLHRANDSQYGLYASVFTRDMSRALRVAKSLESGIVGVNCTSPTFAFDMPFGGVKASGDGREYGRYTLESWTELKAVLISL